MIEISFTAPKSGSTPAVGAAGLPEIFQWLTEEQSGEIRNSEKALVREEMDDVLLFLLRLADKLDIDINEAALDSIESMH
ncbi:hypothetical protein C8R31_101344 [Nitrosospira sp. Nsp2]|uniref:nucleotide pyrophosphohydrolase n=1 Tax=Nitrosospira sp. Nsp2 TaxID=136548 RepID=UPI000D499445|nr:nucleotide pyrophosphohydrolase [Nitrosospira sp. Nsp2]PTR17186.1 hypothetical protein C8R31_101344 [Nitrosospira sp. Nsp2]